MVDLKPSRKQKNLQTQSKILEAAFELFMQRDFNLVSTSEIAERAGVAKGTIFHHFKSKELLAITTLNYFFKMEFDQFSNLKEKSLPEILENFAIGVLGMIDQFPGIQQLTFQILSERKYTKYTFDDQTRDFEGVDSEIAKELNILFGILDEMVENLALIYKQLGYPNPESYSRLFFSLIDGLAIHLFLFPISEELRHQIVKDIVQLFSTLKV